MEALWQDIRYFLRTLRKSPSVPAIILLTVAAAIGANSAIFSVLNAVLLRRLPFKDSDRLVCVWREFPSHRWDLGFFSVPDFIDIRNQNDVLEDMEGTFVVTFSLTGSQEPEQIYAAYVSAGFFSLLGTRAVVGHTFSSDDVTSRANTVVVSYGLWQRRFGSDPALIGKSITLSGNLYTVIGVAPRQFDFPPSFDDAGGLIPWKIDAWVPLDLHARYIEGIDFSDRNEMYLQVLARLKPGITLRQAQSNLETINVRLERQYPVTDKDLGIRVVSFKEQLVRDLRRGLILLLLAVAFVLLIACVNVASLLLARGATRQKEIAIRVAMGASRSRLTRQLLTESVLLALGGGALGLLLAYWGNHLIVAISPETMPRVRDTRLDFWVLAFTLLVSLFTGVLFGLVPALHGCKSEVNEELKEGSRGATTSSRRRSVRSLLVICEISLAFVLMIAAGLMIKSFLKLQAVSPGFTTHGILTVKMKPNRSNYPNEEQRATLYRRVMEQLQTVAGVDSVGIVNVLPLTEGSWFFPAEIEGQPAMHSTERPFMNYHSVSPTYFATMQIPLLKGRNFNQHDVKDSPKVTIINEALARHFFFDTNPIGRRINLVPPPGTAVWLEIIGVVADTRTEHLNREAGFDVYTSYQQPYPDLPNNRMAFVIRTTVQKASMAATVRRELQGVDKDQPVYDIKSMDEYLAESIAIPHLYTLVLSIFAAVGFLLSAVGIYGVTSYVVSERMNEIAIRVALGAQATDVTALVVGHSMVLAGTGLGIGIALSVALTRLMSGLLYEVKVNDPVVFVGLAAVLAGVALAASYIPARRALKLNPMAVLRNMIT